MEITTSEILVACPLTCAWHRHEKQLVGQMCVWSLTQKHVLGMALTRASCFLTCLLMVCLESHQASQSHVFSRWDVYVPMYAMLG